MLWLVRRSNTWHWRSLQTPLRLQARAFENFICKEEVTLKCVSELADGTVKEELQAMGLSDRKVKRCARQDCW